MPTSARSIRGFSYRANRFPISHDSGTHVGGDQWIVQVQCCPQKADQFARKRGVGDTWWFRLTQFVKAFVQSALGFPGDADNSFKKKSGSSPIIVRCVINLGNSRELSVGLG
ncbi:MAG: hypothetical protein F4146_03195 [Rhodothermaceae bacterium]|nr:hypothetical protein [Rhodothermaceae bacterium]